MIVSVARLLTTRVIVAATAALVGVLTVIRAAVFWPRHTYFDMASGVWTALAFDLSRGVFYRPVFGPDGYGGTRYFPLFFAGHAGVIALGVDPLWAGYVMAAFSVALVVIGIAKLLRIGGAAPWLAWAAAILVVAPQVMQHALLAPRPDALAAGLALLGLATLARPTRGVAAAGALFALSFATKVSSVAGLAAGLVWLASGRRWRDAAILGATFGASAALVVLVTSWLSGGRFLEAFSAGVSGTPAVAFLMAPFTMLRIARGMPETAFVLEAGAAIWLLALAVRRAADLPAIYWASAMIFTVPIFAVPNTAANHLVEATAASVLLVAGWALREPDRVTAPAAILVVAAFVASTALAWGLITRDKEQRWGTPAEALAFIPDRAQPILAENPAIAIAAGQRPYMLDAFLYQLMIARDPTFGDPLRDRIRRHAFAAIVLERDPNSERGREWYRSGFFGEGFIDLVTEYYRPAGQSRQRVIYLPR